MPDSKAGTWAALNGSEFTNAQRTIDYIHNFNLPIAIDEDCWCPSIEELLEDCDIPVTGYTFPSVDPAPWYDSAIPESGDFLGFLTTEFEGLGSTYTRSTFETLQGGAVLGRLRAQARTLTWRGYLFGRTCCAAEYGLRWLTAQLSDAGGCGGCDGAELDILICCPEATGSVPNNTTCNVQDVTSCSSNQSVGMAPPLGQLRENQDAFRTFFRTGLIDGPRQLSTRTLGCGGDCEDGPGCLIEVEFSIIAGNPFMHKDKEQVCQTTFPSCDDECDPNDPTWIKIATTAYPATAADGEECLDSLDCSVLDNSVNCIADPNCPTADLPTIPEFEDPCGCEGFFTTRICCEISNDIYGQFFEGVASIDVFSGSTEPLRNVVVSFYENPQERDCTDTALFQSDCFRCAKVNIRYIPPQTTLTVDGLTKRITAKCIGRDPVPAESLTVSPFAWPVLKCISYIVTIEADCSFPISADASATVCVTPREM